MMDRKNLKPWRLVNVKREECGNQWKHVGELVSFPTPDEKIMVRMVPGHPGTMKEVPISSLEPCSQAYDFVHYARVEGKLSFPFDQLSREWAAPLNFWFNQPSEDSRVFPIIDPSFHYETLIIAMASQRKFENWNVARWESFDWKLTPLMTLPLRDQLV